MACLAYDATFVIKLPLDSFTKFSNTVLTHMIISSVYNCLHFLIRLFNFYSFIEY